MEYVGIDLPWLGPTLWMLGFHAAALRVSEQAIRRAQELSHPFTIAFALYFAALVHEFRGDNATLSTQADALVAVAREYAYPFILAAGSIWQGWVRFQAGHREDGLREMWEGLKAYAATGAGQKRTYWLGLIARACLEIRDLEGAQAALTQALQAHRHAGRAILPGGAASPSGACASAGDAGR